MMNFKLKSRHQPIGIDVGHSSVKMIQLGRDGQSIRVEAAQLEAANQSLEPYSREWLDRTAELITAMLRKGGFHGRQAVSCLGGDVLKIKSLRLDTRDPGEIERFMKDEAAGRLGLDINRDEIRYIVAGNICHAEEIKTEAICFGVEQDKLNRHIEMLEIAGLVPVSIDNIPQALFRSFQSTGIRRERDTVNVYADLGSKFTTVIICKGQEINFVKQIPTGGQQFNKQVAERLNIGIEDAARLRRRICRSSQEDPIDDQTRRAVVDAMSSTIEDLAHEISLCLKYYIVTFRGQRPAEAVFTGGEAYEQSLIKALHRHLGIEIKIAEPFNGFDSANVNFNSSFNSSRSEWAIAIGLALKGLELGIEQQEELISV